MFPPRGPVALSSQSGALGLTILELAADRGIGLSTFVSVGNKADVSSNDLLEYWEADPDTSVILLYLESFGNPRKFGELARRIGRRKPIVAVKAGRTRAGVRAASSHTAALAAADAVVDALFEVDGRHSRGHDRRDVRHRVVSSQHKPLPSGRRVAIVTNAGGPGILAVDACGRVGLRWSSSRRRRVRAWPRSCRTPRAVGNPVDMVASASARRLSSDDRDRAWAPSEVDALVDHLHTDRSIAIALRARGHSRRAFAAAACRRLPQARARVPDDGRRRARSLFEVGRRARPGLRVSRKRRPRLVQGRPRYAELAARGARPPPAIRRCTLGDARSLCASVVAARGETWLTAEEIERLLTAYRLPMVLGVLTHGADEAAAVACAIGYPVAAKLSAPRSAAQERHRRRHHVAADFRGSARCRLKAARQCARRTASHPDGVLIQPMIADGVETMVGLAHDPVVRRGRRLRSGRHGRRARAATCTSESCRSPIATPTILFTRAARCHDCPAIAAGRPRISRH